MREVISVHVGQAGVQIGNACCKSYRLLGCFIYIPSRDIPLAMTRYFSLYLLYYSEQKVARC